MKYRMINISRKINKIKHKNRDRILMWKTQMGKTTGKPKWEKLRVAISKERTIAMEKYRINLIGMCPKKRSISDYISLKRLHHINKNSKIGQTMNALRA